MGKGADKDFSERFSRRLGQLISRKFGTGHGWKTKAAKATGAGAQLSRYLTGTIPAADKVKALADGLGCSIEALFDFSTIEGSDVADQVSDSPTQYGRAPIPAQKSFDVERSLRCRSSVTVEDIGGWHPDVGKEFIREFFRTVREGADRGEVTIRDRPPDRTSGTSEGEG